VVSSRPADEGFGQQLGRIPATAPCASRADRIAVIALVGDDRDADRRALVDRLQHIGPRQRIAFVKLALFDDAAAGHGDAVRHQRLLGQFLVDGDDRGDQPGMGIGQAHQVHHALHRAILARRAVERVEHDVGLGLGSRSATSRPMSMRVTRWPRDSSALATPSPLISETGRSLDQPPIRTAT
jgi:hypothetical protein